MRKSGDWCSDGQNRFSFKCIVCRISSISIFNDGSYMRSDWMEKIQITKEQDKAIKFLLERRNEWSEERLIRYHANRNDKWVSPSLQCLNDLPLNDLCLRLYAPDSYEVIPQFKVGEWLFISKETTYTVKDEIRKIAGVQNGTIKLEDNWYIGIHSEYIRHATPEEIQQEKKRRFWDKLGREVDEYKEGDIVAYRDLFTPLIDVELNNRKVHFPSDSGRFDVPIEEVLLSIPVEQRLDK